MGEAFDDMMDDAGIEDAAEHLRRDFIEAIEQLDGSRAERRDLESTHLLEKITKMVWFQNIEDDTQGVLSDIRQALDGEQHDSRTVQDRLFHKLRASVDAFSDGMTKNVQGLRKHILHQKKDALSIQRSAAGKEVQIELQKAKHDADTRYNEMKARLEGEIRRLQQEYDNMLFKKDTEIDRYKKGLKDKTDEFDKMKEEFDRMNAQFGQIFGEADKLRDKCTEQAKLIADLQIEISKLTQLRDHMEELEAQMNERVFKILDYVRGYIRTVDNVLPRPKDVMSGLETMPDEQLLDEGNEAIDALLRDRVQNLEKVAALQKELANIALAHQQEMMALKARIAAHEAELSKLNALMDHSQGALMDQVAALEQRVADLLEDKRILTTALDRAVQRVEDEHNRIAAVQQEQEKYLLKYRSRINELEAGQNERKQLELQMIAENRKTSELRHLSRLCTRLLRDKDEKEGELAEAIAGVNAALAGLETGNPQLQRSGGTQRSGLFGEPGTSSGADGLSSSANFGGGGLYIGPLGGELGVHAPGSAYSSRGIGSPDGRWPQESAPGRWPSDTALILRERASRQGGSLGGWPNTSSSIPEAQAAAQRLGFFRGEGGGRSGSSLMSQSHGSLPTIHA